MSGATTSSKRRPTMLRKVRIMTLFDEFTRECLAIAGGPSHDSFGDIATMARPDARTRRAGTHPLRQPAATTAKSRAGLAFRKARSKDALYIVARQPVGERLLLKFASTASCAASCTKWSGLLQPEGSQGCDPAMAQALQQRFRPHSSLNYKPKPAPQTLAPEAISNLDQITAMQ